MTLDAVAEKFGDLLPKMKWLNFGGGHHITRPGYDMATLEKCIRRARNDWGVTVYLEPGEACALNAGYLLTRVLDVVQNGDTTVAILDASAACHTPDVIEMPYRPPLLGAGEPGEKPCTVRLPGRPALRGMSSVITALTLCLPWEICWCSAIWPFTPPARTTPSTVCPCPVFTPASPTALRGKS